MCVHTRAHKQTHTHPTHSVPVSKAFLYQVSIYLPKCIPRIPENMKKVAILPFRTAVSQELTFEHKNVDVAIQITHAHQHATNAH